jgi:4-hydroxybutyryl-CoA dehydratase/vinylacetyl-CoA-Delta-isomerase
MDAGTIEKAVRRRNAACEGPRREEIAMLMSGADYRESLRRARPRVFVEGRAVEAVADDPALAPGVAAMGVAYDYALRNEYRPLMVAEQHTSGREVNRMVHINRTSSDLLAKLEAVRLVCQETGCAQRYLTMDAFNGLFQTTWHLDKQRSAGRHQRFLDYMHWVQDEDLTTAIAMTDGKGDRSLRPHEQAAPDSYVHVTERRADGIVIRGTKAIVTGAPYMHEILVLPCRNMIEADRDFAVACAVPIDAPGVTISARPAGRPGEKAALFSGRYGQSLGAIFFDDVFVPDSRVFLDGEWEWAGHLARTYATHHRHTCIAARAGFGDLLIGAGTLTMEANGLSPATAPHLRDRLVDLIKTVEGIFATGVAASVYAMRDPAGNIEPEPVYSNIGKLMLATQIYDMHRIAHEVAGGMIAALPGPDEDHNPATAGVIADSLRGHPDVPYAHRAKLARFLEDLTVSSTAGWYSTISLHGGGSPEAMKMEIFRNYPIPDKVALVERLLDRGLLPGRMDASGNAIDAGDQAGRCCPQGCRVPELPPSLRKNTRS